MDYVFDNPFKPAPQTYKREIDPVGQSVTQYAYYLHKQTGVDLSEARDFVITNLKPAGIFALKDKPMTYLVRGDNGDRLKVEGGLLEYIADSVKQRDILSPSFTAYVSTDIERSLLSEYARINIALRAAAKKEAFAAEARKDWFVQQIKKLEQNNRKLSNNSLSGAHCSVSTPLYNKTAHSTLTSICRITSGYGNANNEKILAGNRHYYSYDITLNNITSIITNTDYELLEAIIVKYSLHLPTAQDCLNVIVGCAWAYWREKDQYAKLYQYLAKLTPLERAAFAYTGDFYTFRQFNPELTREILTRLSTKVVGQMQDPVGFMKFCTGEVINLTHQICTTEMAGRGHAYKNFADTQDMQTVACTAKNVMDTVMLYGDIFKFVFTSKNVPSDIGRFPESLRKVVLTSDTDSTIFTVQEWVLWYSGSYKLDSQAIAMQATMTFLAACSIVHVLATVSINMGVARENMYLIEMKSEFRFDTFVPTQIGKTYYADIGCQEGNVYPEYKMEIKGVQLKSSNIPKTINKLGEELMIGITTTMRGDQLIDANYYLKKVAQMEKGIELAIRNNETTYLRAGSIKDANSYGLPPTQSPYQIHVFWNEVFGPKYGVMPEPPYVTRKVSLVLPNPTALKAWFDSIEDEAFKLRAMNYFANKGKTEFKTFNVPTSVLKNKGFPIEVLPVIDYRKIAKELCRNLYLVLETLGFYFKDTELVSDLYPHFTQMEQV